MRETKIYKLTGDAMCPYCSLIHITPEEADLQEGKLECQFCDKESYLTEDKARQGNKLAKKKLFNTHPPKHPDKEEGTAIMHVEDVRGLKKYIKSARKQEKETFSYKGRTYLVDYAEHLIKYLANQFGLDDEE